MTDYDPLDAVDRTKRKKRISKITGKPTKYREETEAQIAIVTYYDKRCRIDRNLRLQTRLFAVAPNDGKRSGRGNQTASDMGQRSGVFDLHLLDIRSGKLRTVWLEVKSSVGKLSAEQKTWALWLGLAGIETRVVRSVAEFEQVLNGL